MNSQTEYQRNGHDDVCRPVIRLGLMAHNYSIAHNLEADSVFTSDGITSYHVFFLNCRIPAQSSLGD